ncbi:MAG: ATP-binding protein [Candidatus Spechtbacteria bacterium]|nr:ATP-binding protein [Candidatus Spechtbacteria bacterium]
MPKDTNQQFENALAQSPEANKQQLQTLRDIIAPAALEINASFIKLGDSYARTLFVFSYPRFLTTNWFSPIINMGNAVDVSMFIHPLSTEQILKTLERQITSVEADLMERSEKGLIRDPILDAAYQNIEELRDKLQQAEEKMFKFGLYITIYATSEKGLEQIESEVRAVLESRMVYMKPALYQQTAGFNSSLPVLFDELLIYSSLNTSPLSSIFPFVSFDLTADKGILYGINRHNSSLILFDRFSLENANAVVFGKSGAGKSYAIKLEILRSLMFGDDVLVIDPENEYQYLAETVGGSFFKLSLTSEHHINPFDLPPVGTDENASDVLRSTVVTLMGLVKVMLGTMTPEEESLLDQAITQTYASRDITPERENFEGIVPPRMGDLYTVLQNIEGAESLALRLQPYVEGIYAGFLNQPTNINLDSQLVVFNIRDMEDELRPVAMFLILHYIWDTIRRTLKKRVLIIDEAWWMMQHENSAAFLYAIAKRCRKYYMGLTTISQDVSDFMVSNYGKPIVTNSSLQLLLKQSPASIDVVQNTFHLTDEEKYLLLEGAVGEGLFFAGTKHVAIKVIASYTEDQIITSDPVQLLQIEKAREELENEPAEEVAQ